MATRAAGSRTLCVYCGSSNRIPDSHKSAADRLGRLLADDGCRLVYGGGRVGLMGIVADAMIAGGGQYDGTSEPGAGSAFELRFPVAR